MLGSYHILKYLLFALIVYLILKYILNAPMQDDEMITVIILGTIVLVFIDIFANI